MGPVSKLVLSTSILGLLGFAWSAPTAANDAFGHSYAPIQNLPNARIQSYQMQSPPVSTPAAPVGLVQVGVAYVSQMVPGVGLAQPIPMPIFRYIQLQPIPQQPQLLFAPSLQSAPSTATQPLSKAPSAKTTSPENMATADTKEPAVVIIGEVSPTNAELPNGIVLGSSEDQIPVAATPAPEKETDGKKDVVGGAIKCAVNGVVLLTSSQDDCKKIGGNSSWQTSVKRSGSR